MGCPANHAHRRGGQHHPAATDHEEAIRLGQQATAKDTRGIFRFNSGKERKTFPAYNPYTIQRCRDCDIAKGDGKTNLAAFILQSDLCEACQLVRQCVGDREKSQAAIQRKHYIDKEMAPLLRIKHEKLVPNGVIKVGFTKIGNEHLYSDTFGRSKGSEERGFEGS